MQQYSKCKWCGKLFQNVGLPFCPKCMQELDEQYKPVRDYLYDNPNASVEDVVEATGVSEKVILFYLKDGRLSMANSSGYLRCEQCGASMTSGRLCEKCAGKLEQRMVQPMQARQQQAEERRQEERRSALQGNKGMHTYDYNDQGRNG